ncbi:hypothetical protein MLD38_032272 [Melastoma candidum]|uniref:Uncharacterized protein n=1 Tax=Melastoma candidum TaxID=119954 RepID=A0ACB9M3S0_9MYRT|nr:hypothetical protein MLD38_032272 [Melastoma candidum]
MTIKPSLPISHPEDGPQPVAALLRRRLSSLSLRVPPATDWALCRTKSVSSAIGSGESLRSWWDWGWSWILSRKPVFARDLELNEEEAKAIGSSSRGSWRHVFYKVRSEIRRLIRPDHAVLPQTCRYDSFSYRNNFDRHQPRAVGAY